MTRFVVDASVATKWFLPESHAAEALRLLEAEHELIVPEFLFAEVGNALWKRCLKGEATPADMRATLAALDALPLRVESSRRLVMAGGDLAVRLRWPIYDCLYLALADREDCALVTADRKFLDVMANKSSYGRLLWVADVKA